MRTSDIAPSAVDPFKTNLTKVSAAAGQVSTTSNTAVEALGLGYRLTDPSVRGVA